MQIQLTGAVTHNGVEYLPGQILTCSDEDAMSLIKARVATKDEMLQVPPVSAASVLEPKQEAKPAPKPEPAKPSPKKPEIKKPEIKKPKPKTR